MTGLQALKLKVRLADHLVVAAIPRYSSSTPWLKGLSRRRSPGCSTGRRSWSRDGCPQPVRGAEGAGADEPVVVEREDILRPTLAAVSMVVVALQAAPVAAQVVFPTPTEPVAVEPGSFEGALTGSIDRIKQALERASAADPSHFRLARPHGVRRRRRRGP